MAPPLLDLSQLDLEREVMSEDEVRALIPHRHEFQLIDRVCHLDVEAGVVVGVKDWDANPWWARGHVPGQPIMPGVLLIEGSAQISTILMKKVPGGWDDAYLIGLAGVDKARFRGQVTPPARCCFIAKVGKQSRRLARYPVQCIVDGQVVFDMELLGAPLS